MTASNVKPGIASVSAFALASNGAMSDFTSASNPSFKGSIARQSSNKPATNKPLNSSSPAPKQGSVLPKAWGGTDYSLVNVPSTSLWDGQPTSIPVISRDTKFKPKYPSNPASVKAAAEANKRQDIYAAAIDTGYWNAAKNLPAEAVHDLIGLGKLAVGGLKNIGKAAIFAGGSILDAMNGNQKALNAKKAQIAALKQRMTGMLGMVNNARIMLVQNPSAVLAPVKAWLQGPQKHIEDLRAQGKDQEAGEYLGGLFIKMGKTTYEAFTGMAMLQNLPKAVKNAPAMAKAVGDALKYAPANFVMRVDDLKNWTRLLKNTWALERMAKPATKDLPALFAFVKSLDAKTFVKMPLEMKIALRQGLSGLSKSKHPEAELALAKLNHLEGLSKQAITGKAGIGKTGMGKAGMGKAGVSKAGVGKAGIPINTPIKLVPVPGKSNIVPYNRPSKDGVGKETKRGKPLLGANNAVPFKRNPKVLVGVLAGQPPKANTFGNPSANKLNRASAKTPSGAGTGGVGGTPPNNQSVGAGVGKGVSGGGFPALKSVSSLNDGVPLKLFKQVQEFVTDRNIARSLTNSIGAKPTAEHVYYVNALKTMLNEGISPEKASAIIEKAPKGWLAYLSKNANSTTEIEGIAKDINSFNSTAKAYIKNGIDNDLGENSSREFITNLEHSIKYSTPLEHGKPISLKNASKLLSASIAPMVHPNPSQMLYPEDIAIVLKDMKDSGLSLTQAVAKHKVSAEFALTRFGSLRDKDITPERVREYMARYHTNAHDAACKLYSLDEVIHSHFGGTGLNNNVVLEYMFKHSYDIEFVTAQVDKIRQDCSNQGHNLKEALEYVFKHSDGNISLLDAYHNEYGNLHVEDDFDFLSFGYVEKNKIDRSDFFKGNKDLQFKGEELLVKNGGALIADFSDGKIIKKVGSNDGRVFSGAGHAVQISDFGNMDDRGRYLLTSIDDAGAPIFLTLPNGRKIRLAELGLEQSNHKPEGAELKRTIDQIRSVGNHHFSPMVPSGTKIHGRGWDFTLP